MVAIGAGDLVVCAVVETGAVFEMAVVSTGRFASLLCGGGATFSVAILFSQQSMSILCGRGGSVGLFVSCSRRIEVRWRVEERRGLRRRGMVGAAAGRTGNSSTVGVGAVLAVRGGPGDGGGLGVGVRDAASR